MHLKALALSAGFAAGLAALPLATAQAQYYGPPCNPFPLTWPFCVAGAAVYTAGAIVSAPFRALTPPPPPPPGPPPVAYRPPPPGAAGPPAGYRPPAAAGVPGPAGGYRPAGYAPGDWRWQRWCYNHPRKCAAAY